MTEKVQYIVQLHVQGVNVDKVISIGVSPDEFVNLDRAEKIGMKLVKRVEILRETTLVMQPEQRVTTTQPPQTQPQPQTQQQEQTTQETKFGKPTQVSDILQPKQSSASDDEIDNMITKPNQVEK